MRCRGSCCGCTRVGLGGVAGEPTPPSPYQRPRVYGAAALIGAVVVMLVLDAISKDYALSDTTLTILVGGALGLLGLELRDIRKRD